MGHRWFTSVVRGFGALVALAVGGVAHAETTFYESVFVRDTAAPQQITTTFTMEDVEGDFTLVVWNGDAATGDDRVTSALISLNGVAVVTTNDFNKNVEVVEKLVTLAPSNELTVEVRGGPGTYITVAVVGELWNRRPVAAAGPDLNALRLAPVVLDGSDTFDPDGDLVSYRWTLLSAPVGSQARLSDPARADPKLTPDLAGEYVVELIASDAQVESAPAQVIVTAFDGVAAPNARAGADQYVLLGPAVDLRGTDSYDPAGLGLGYRWSFVEVPLGSGLTDLDLTAAELPVAQFTPDVAGTYTIRLVVDNATFSDEDTVRVYASDPNVKPKADAGPDKASRSGQLVSFDGSASFDPDAGPSPLSYEWGLVSRPAGSAITAADIVGPNTATPTLTPDLQGSYVARLTVSDAELSDAENVLLMVEDTPPGIDIAAPGEGALITTPRPLFEVDFEDKESGIDVESFRAELDGVDITDGFVVGTGGATYLPSADLQAGERVLTASVADRAGNQASTQSAFTVAYLRAIPGATPVEGYAPLSVRLTMDGEDPNGTIQVFRWDFDGNGSYDSYDTVARDYSRTYSSVGTYNATLYVWSSTGQRASASIPIRVLNSPPSATADVVPSNGAVPLTVNLIGSGSDRDGQIVLYEWDFEGDGLYDWSSTTTGNTTHTYTTEGTFSAVFRVTDNSGQTATAVAVTTTVRIGPAGSPTATASAAPASGNAPLTVSFSGTGTDPEGDIRLYEWDFDNDGVYDYSSPSSGNATHTYTQAGTHVATFRVTDGQGLSGVDQVLSTVNIQTSLSVAANTVGFLPGTGLSASASSEYSASYAAGKAVDGVYNTYWHTAPGGAANSWIEVTFARLQQLNAFTIQWYSYSYRMTGARVELFDDAGSLLHTQDYSLGTNAASHVIDVPDTANVRRVRVSALSTYSAYVVIRELLFEMVEMPGQQAEPTGTTINTSVSADTYVSVLIKDAGGNLVRTLVNNENRPLGAYQDYWDTRDDNGVVVNDGRYYAVLQYLVDGEIKTLDLTATTGGTRYSFPFGSGCDTRANFANVISPFEDDFLELAFTLCSAQEVTLFIGPLWTGGDAARIRTIVNRQPFPAGTHTIYWDGLDDDGNIAVAPPGDSLITGAWRYTEPANAIHMSGGRPVIGTVAADPNYFSPFSEKCDAEGRSEGITLSYTVSEAAATVELRVYSIDTGALVRRVMVANVPAGGNILFWDAKNNDGEYVDIGEYQVGVMATDAEGNQSMLRYSLVRVDY